MLADVPILQGREADKTLGNGDLASDGDEGSRVLGGGSA